MAANIQRFLDAYTLTLDKNSPEHQTDDAVAGMIQYAHKEKSHPAIVELATEITQDIHPNDKISQMMAVLNWVLANLNYVKDEEESQRMFGTSGDIELVKSPVAVLKTRRYDCDCGSTLIAALFMALRIPVRFVTVSFHTAEETGPDGYEHVYAQGLDSNSNQWVVVDPVSHPNERQMLLDTKQSKIYDV